MAGNLYLGVWTADKMQRFKVDDIDLESNVEGLRQYLVKELGETAANNLEFTFCGLLLEESKPLSNYGVTSGGTIHVIQKPKPKPVRKAENKKITEEIIQDFVSKYRNFRVSSSFRCTLHRLEDPAELDKVIAAVPGLQEDPIAVAFISQPDLFMQMEDPKTCWQIAEKNPVILSAAQYVVTEFHKSTAASSSPASQAAPVSGHSYSLDALSDDDDDMEGEGTSQGGSGGGITAAQLAAAIAAASAAPVSRITPEMVQQALAPGNGTTRYASQLRQMRELGLNDEQMNLRALTAAQGDVHAAIDLVFSGAVDD